MIVAIDGPAGSGKSTVAHEIARRRGLTYLDTGAMYRSVTVACLDRGVDLSDADALSDVARSVSISFEQDGDAQRVLLDGRDVTERIRSALVDRNVSVVSAVTGVREAMVALQRAVGDTDDVVAEGRDIGTAVFPDAEVKVFLTADPAARAHRRAVQREGGDAAVADERVDADEERRILEDLERRDKIDSTRKASPLVAASDAVHIDSSDCGVDEVCSRIEGLIDAVGADRG